MNSIPSDALALHHRGLHHLEVAPRYTQIVPPGSRTGRHRHLAEEGLHVLEGRGYDPRQDCDVAITGTYRWAPQAEIKQFDGEAGDVIYIPPNTIHQQFNAEPDRPARPTAAIWSSWTMNRNAGRRLRSPRRWCANS